MVSFNPLILCTPQTPRTDIVDPSYISGWIQFQDVGSMQRWKSRFFCLLEQDCVLAYWKRRPEFRDEQPEAVVRVNVEDACTLTLECGGRHQGIRLSFPSPRLKDMWLDRLLVMVNATHLRKGSQESTWMQRHNFAQSLSARTKSSWSSALQSLFHKNAAITTTDHQRSVGPCFETLERKRTLLRSLGLYDAIANVLNTDASYEIPRVYTPSFFSPKDSTRLSFSQVLHLLYFCVMHGGPEWKPIATWLRGAPRRAWTDDTAFHVNTQDMVVLKCPHIDVVIRQTSGFYTVQPRLKRSVSSDDVYAEALRDYFSSDDPRRHRCCWRLSAAMSQGTTAPSVLGSSDSIMSLAESNYSYKSQLVQSFSGSFHDGVNTVSSTSYAMSLSFSVDDAPFFVPSRVTAVTTTCNPRARRCSVDWTLLTRYSLDITAENATKVETQDEEKKHDPCAEDTPFKSTSPKQHISEVFFSHLVDQVANPLCARLLCDTLDCVSHLSALSAISGMSLRHRAALAWETFARSSPYGAIVSEVLTDRFNDVSELQLVDGVAEEFLDHVLLSEHVYAATGFFSKSHQYTVLVLSRVPVGSGKCFSYRLSDCTDRVKLPGGYELDTIHLLALQHSTEGHESFVLVQKIRVLNCTDISPILELDHGFEYTFYESLPFSESSREKRRHIRLRARTFAEAQLLRQSMICIQRGNMTPYESAIKQSVGHTVYYFAPVTRLRWRLTLVPYGALRPHGVTSTPSDPCNDDPCHHCSQMHRGILHRVMDPDNLAKGCFVYAVLYCNSLELYRGKTIVNKFDVNAIVTPILLTSGSHLCFTVKMVGSEAPEILCAENLNCRNEWWKALTRAVLCTHHGTELRHEVAGEPIMEEEEQLVAEKVVEKPEKGGINIKLSGITDMPIVKLKKTRKITR